MKLVDDLRTEQFSSRSENDGLAVLLRPPRALLRELQQLPEGRGYAQLVLAPQPGQRFVWLEVALFGIGCEHCIKWLA